MLIHSALSGLVGIAFGFLYHQLFTYSITQLYKRCRKGSAFAYAMTNFVLRYAILATLLVIALFFTRVHHITFVTAFIIVFFASTIKIAKANI